ncbi:SIR2-like domain-containing protein [Desulfonispora thiosulfatigenes DSM 11270]|uniref:SIR2-like domain-containing protein n=1 Tax=Desulfonispora thiosulfatigenes DSM 11270 TaxID=656914 RepID=A0A1W1UKQ4_DESTI|nr:hypothetical protein [Desulfonispora thiosulfatigenes]SMB81657.1 SIR2-like domain-containing protein [Desulfonispora thiosulfatigenes DSM 11270]
MTNDTVYIIGAGINQCITDYEGLNPPLTLNFFKTILKSTKYQSKEYVQKVNLVYEYIEKYWKMDKENLINRTFNLEECFTLIQLQLMEAIEENKEQEISYLLRINSALKIMFVQFLADFEEFINSSKLMRDFGKLIYQQKPNIITFNYDCNVERSIETASGLLNERKHNQYKWKYPLSYGVEFDQIVIDGIKVDQSYYQKNKLYDWKILKLHGSLNWFKYLPVDQKRNLQQNGKVVLTSEKWWLTEPENIDGLIIDPVIIPPVLYKNYNQELIWELWVKAKECLSQCKNLIVIGYSFPPTDFGIRKLLLESFENNSLEKLVIVNPDTTIVSKLKKLVHYDKPVLVCSDLSEFLHKV